MSEPWRTEEPDPQTDLAPVRRWLGLAAIVVACFAVYAPALTGDFVWDDDTHLIDNPVLREGGLHQVWLEPPQEINYWPMTFTTYWVEHQLWGLDPVGYHVVNVLIHALNALLIWIALRRLRVPLPWLAALLFAVHPVNVESVAWITQRKNLLSFFFFALSLCCYLRFEDRRSAGSYVAALAFFLVAMLSKGAAAPLPAVLLLCAWWRRGVIDKRDGWRVAPFFAVAGVMSLLELSTQVLVAEDFVVRADGFVARLAGAGWVAWFYLYKALLPVGLSFVYPRWQIDPSLPWVWLPTVAGVALLAIAWRWRDGWGRPALFGLVYTLLMLSPVLGFFDIYYMRFSFVADHYQYLALIGILALVVGGLGSVLTRRSDVPRPVLIGAAAAAIVFCAVSSAVQSASYRNSETLWRDTLARNPEAFLAHYNLARLLHAEERLDAAAYHYSETLRIRPDDVRAINNLGRIHQDRGEAEQAIEAYRRALSIDPTFLEARNNLAVMFQKSRRPRAALSQYREALRYAPDSPEVHYNLALLLERLGQRGAAALHFRRSIELDPGSEVARRGLERVQAGGSR
ncbi:MAG: tetratricopeptide repeat protein [Myxococcota bacterium]